MTAGDVVLTAFIVVAAVASTVYSIARDKGWL